MHSRYLAFTFVLMGLLLGSANVARAQPGISINFTSANSTGMGLSNPTFSGNLAIPMGSVINNYSFSVVGTGGAYMGGLTYSKRPMGGGGMDIYDIMAGATGIPTGTYRGRASITYTAPGATMSTTLEAVTDYFTLP